jgi:hypothetical protein
MAEPVSVRYELLSEDIRQLQEFLATPEGRRILRVQYARGVVLAVVLTLLVVLLTGTRDPLAIGGTFVALAGSCVVAWRAYIRSYYFGDRSAVLLSNRTGTGLGTHTMWLDECGIREAGPVREAQHRWSAVGGVHETANLFVLPVGVSGQYVVPKRAFASADDAEAFRARALDWWRMARRWDGPAGAK